MVAPPKSVAFPDTEAPSIWKLPFAVAKPIAGPVAWLIVKQPTRINEISDFTRSAPVLCIMNIAPHECNTFLQVPDYTNARAGVLLHLPARPGRLAVPSQHSRVGCQSCRN